MTTPGREPNRRSAPLDRANGFRVGAAAGVLLGAAILAVTGMRSFWIVGGAALAGGVVGYWLERNRSRG